MALAGIKRYLEKEIGKINGALKLSEKVSKGSPLEMDYRQVLVGIRDDLDKLVNEVLLPCRPESKDVDEEEGKSKKLSTKHLMKEKIIDNIKEAPVEVMLEGEARVDVMAEMGRTKTISLTVKDTLNPEEENIVYSEEFVKIPTGMIGVVVPLEYDVAGIAPMTPIIGPTDVPQPIPFLISFDPEDGKSAAVHFTAAELCFVKLHETLLTLIPGEITDPDEAYAAEEIFKKEALESLKDVPEGEVVSNVPQHIRDARKNIKRTQEAQEEPKTEEVITDGNLYLICGDCGTINDLGPDLSDSIKGDYFVMKANPEGAMACKQCSKGLFYSDSMIRTMDNNYKKLISTEKSREE